MDEILEKEKDEEQEMNIDSPKPDPEIYNEDGTFKREAPEGETRTPSSDVVEENEAPKTEDENGENVVAPEKTLTQSQVNELVGRARQEGRESAMRDLMARYGVSDDNELDNIFGRGQAYDDLDYDFKNQSNSYKEAMAENALLKTHIDENRFEDVKLILNGKGLDVSVENIMALLPTHPEWKGQEGSGMNTRQPLSPEMGEAMMNNEFDKPQVKNKPATLSKLGSEPSSLDKGMTEEEIFNKLYNF